MMVSEVLDVYKFDTIKFFQITDQMPELRYSPLVCHYLSDVKQLPGEIRAPYTGCYFFLTDILGIGKKDAAEEVAYFMNAVCDAID
ncbi:MAG: hypothetical protein JWR03_1615 [Cohnella sp.]|jgi:hypothetical protein|nr:hypothetical protein [Cohnella sp.]